MTRLEIIAAELQNDPKILGYAQLSHQAAADKMNEVGASAETRDRTLIDTWELAAAVVLSEWNNVLILGTSRELFRAICSCVRVDVQNARLRQTIAAIFTNAAAPQTRARMLELQVESISRAEALGLVSVVYTEVAQARGE